jgi:hypothetical protein
MSFVGTFSSVTTVVPSVPCDALASPGAIVSAAPAITSATRLRQRVVVRVLEAQRVLNPPKATLVRE